MRARAVIEDDGGKPRIIVTEIPFMVNKARMIEQIAELVREKRVTDITALRDESDRDGIRVVIELKRDAIPQIVLNQLFKHTQMQSTFGVILLALVPGEKLGEGRGGIPKVLNLKELIQYFIDHRHDVVVRRTEHDLAEALEREHILEGLKIAVDNIDEVVELIKTSPDTDTASTRLQERFQLSERQAKATRHAARAADRSGDPKLEADWPGPRLIAEHGRSPGGASRSSRRSCESPRPTATVPHRIVGEAPTSRS